MCRFESGTYQCISLGAIIISAPLAYPSSCTLIGVARIINASASCLIHTLIGVQVLIPTLQLIRTFKLSKSSSVCLCLAILMIKGRGYTHTTDDATQSQNIQVVLARRRQWVGPQSKYPLSAKRTMPHTSNREMAHKPA